MDRKSVIEFLLNAKKATYAGKGPEKKSVRPGSHDYEYEQEGIKYNDSYVGGKNFCGEETLTQDTKFTWAMNYCGRILNEKKFDGDFLKKALLNGTETMPYRGPGQYKSGDLTYTCTVKGDFDWFIGYEQIANGNEKVYECMFHGGSIE